MDRRRMVQRLATYALAVGAVAAAPRVGAAQTVNFAGYTNGCWGLGCTPTASSAYQLLTLGNLTWQNSTFSGATLNGFAGIGNTATPPGVQNVDNLGAFDLGPAPYNYTGQKFTMMVTFTAPGSATQLFTAAVTGQVAPKQGGVFIDFDNTPQSFAYNNGGQSGLLSLSVNDVSLIAPPTGSTFRIAVSGNLTATATPEPATYAMLLPGLLGIFAVRSRKKLVA